MEGEGKNYSCKCITSVTASGNTYRYTIHRVSSTLYVFHLMLVLLCYSVALGSIG